MKELERSVSVGHFLRDKNRGWNEIHLLSFEPANGYEEDDRDGMIAQTVDSIVSINEHSIAIGGYGGYAVDDGQFCYYMVQWLCDPWQIKNDEIITVEMLTTHSTKMSGFAVVYGWTVYLQQRSIGS